jgi:mono/diheme cytochrome c family protein
MVWRFGMALILTSAYASTALAQQEEPAVQRGRTFTQNNCASCHSIDRITASPLAVAPPFRDLHKKYPIEDLAEAFAEGISTGHPTMPEFKLDPGQIGDLLAFMKSLERS